MTRRTARRGRTALGWLLALALTTAGAWAEPARVVIYPPPAADPLVSEALIRIRAELRAVGLRVELHDGSTMPPGDPQLLGPGDYGVIVLSEQQSRIDIRAYAPGLETPVRQSAHTSYPGMDAEVVAVRAVEALRAAMIQFTRNRDASSAALPPAVGDFTRLGAAPEPEPEPPSPKPPRVAEPTPAPEGASQRPSPWSIWLGPVVLGDLPARQMLVGVHGALFWQSSWFRVGVSAEQSFGGGRVVEPEGAANLERTSALGWVGATHTLSPDAFVYVLAGGGLAYYQAHSEAAGGFSSRSGSHSSPLLGLRAGAGLWVTEHFGLYASLGAETLTRAPRLRFDGRDVALVGRPSTSLSLGILLGP